MDDHNYKDLKVCVSRGPLDMGAMICDTLLKMGILTWKLSEKNCDGANIVILPCSGTGLDQSFLSQTVNTNRSAVALWMIDPLPPARLGNEAQNYLDQIALLDSRRCMKEPWGEIFHKYVPGVREIMRFRRRNRINRFKKFLMQTKFKNYADCPNREWERIFVRAHIIEQRLQNKYYDLVFTTTAAKQDYLINRGYDSVFVPFGYHESFGRMLSLKRDIDVVFLGRLNNKKRITLLHGLRQLLNKKGIKLEIIDRDCFGEERENIMNRSKISLDLPRIPWDFACERFLISMGCGALVISVGSQDCAPYVRNKHYVQTQETDLADKICYYLENHDERTSIVDSAYNFVTGKLLLRNSLQDIMDLCISRINKNII